MPARGECATAGDVDDIAVRLGAGDVLSRNVSAGSDLVLDQDGAVVEVRPDLFRDPARDEVRSAAGSEADDKVNVLRWVGLCERIISERITFSDVADALNHRLRRVSRAKASSALLNLLLSPSAHHPRGSAIHTQSPAVLDVSGKDIEAGDKVHVPLRWRWDGQSRCWHLHRAVGGVSA